MSSNFSIFNSKLLFLACHKKFLIKKGDFLLFSTKKASLVKLDIKNGFYDSFPFQKFTVRPQHSALPLILFVFIHDFASLTQFMHSFHFPTYLMSLSPICHFNLKSQKIISGKLNQMSQFLKNIFSNKYFEFIIKSKIL